MIATRLSHDRTIELYKDFKKYQGRYNENQLLQISDVLIENLLHYRLIKRTKKVLFFLLDRYSIVLVTKCSEKEDVSTKERSQRKFEHEGYISMREKKYFLLQRKIRLHFFENNRDCVKIIREHADEFSFLHMKARTLILMDNLPQCQDIIQQDGFPNQYFYLGLLSMVSRVGEKDFARRCFTKSDSYYMLGLEFFQQGVFENSLKCFMKELFEHPTVYASNFFIWLRIGDCFSGLSKLSIQQPLRPEKSKKKRRNMKFSFWSSKSVFEVYEYNELLDFSKIAYRNAIQFLPPTMSILKPKILLKLMYIHLQQENPRLALQEGKNVKYDQLSEYERVCFVEYSIEGLLLTRKWKKLAALLKSPIVRQMNLLHQVQKFRPHLLYLIYFFQGRYEFLEAEVFARLTKYDESPQDEELEKGVKGSGQVITKKKKIRPVDPKLQIIRFIAYFLRGEEEGFKLVSDMYRKEILKIEEMERKMRGERSYKLIDENDGNMFT